MALLRFFKVPKHQRYEYKPRYWDQKKEEREERLAQLKAMEGTGADAIKARLSGGFRRGYAKDASIRRKQMMRSNLMLVTIIVSLVVISYLLLVVYLPKIEAMLGAGGAVN